MLCELPCQPVGAAVTSALHGHTIKPFLTQLHGSCVEGGGEAGPQNCMEWLLGLEAAGE